ncbi:S8 family peptidase [Micromonospora chersina]|uniref:S8 family peptidase n=1 Tax=Micromonospora chersina TaxID=47854 RepID=UPI0037B2170B
MVDARDFTASTSGTKDVVGHGTHVAGIITGNGSAAGGKYVGVAPDAKLLIGKVLGDEGSGSESGIIAGMEWAVAEGADVVNMSLATEGPGDGTGPMDLAVNRLTAQTGTLFVVAAGNTGPDESSIGSPGSAESALTVGAVDRDDQLAPFSSRGPVVGSLGLKPDITAPGVDIVSALASGSILGEQVPVVDERYLALSGTSMATPHVAGAAAILASQHTDWDADDLKSALMNSSKPSRGAPAYEQGAGRVDVARAVLQSVFATPASLDNGIARWPHEDDQPIRKTVTYHNDGTTPITLKVAVDAPDAPEGMFTVDHTDVTVPANGTASVQLVTNTAVPTEDRLYSGTVVATSDLDTLRTPFGVSREPESYDVTMTVLDRSGNLTPDYSIRLVDLVNPIALRPYDASGKVVARVRKGRYYLESTTRFADSKAPTGQATALFVEPELAVTQNVELVIDARQSKAIGIKVDRPDAKMAGGTLEIIRGASWGETGFVFFGDTFDGIYIRPNTTTVTSGPFSFFVKANLARPDKTGRFMGSPYLYHVASTTEGRVPEEPTVRIHDRDLVTVHTQIAATSPGEIASKDFLVDLPTPAKLTELYTPGTEWSPSVAINPNWDAFEFDRVIISTEVTYQGGNPVDERWNVGVSGPAFVKPFFVADRFGPFLAFNIPLAGDQALNHVGESRLGTTTLKLSQDGKLIGESPASFGLFEVPSGGGELELEARAVQPTRFSTDVHATWTFHAAEGKQPLMAVRFAPNLDEHNRAKAGRVFAFPVTVQEVPGASVGWLKQLRVSVSYDDGKTWSPATVDGDGLTRVVVLAHPKSTGFVSLRATAVDGADNKVEQTIIRAYELTR